MAVAILGFIGAVNAACGNSGIKVTVNLKYSIRGGNAGNFRWNIVNIVVDAVILILTLIGYQSLSFLWRGFGIFILIITIVDVSSCIRTIRNSYKEK